MVVRSKERSIGIEDVAELENSLKNNNQTLVMWGNPRVIYDIQYVTDALCKRKHWDLCLFGRGKGHFVLETVRSKKSLVLMFPSSMPTNWMIALSSVVHRRRYSESKKRPGVDDVGWKAMVNMKNKNKNKTAFSSKPLLSQAHFSISDIVFSQPVYTEMASDMNASFTPEDGGLRIENLLWSMQCAVWQKDQIPMLLSRLWAALLCTHK